MWRSSARLVVAFAAMLLAAGCSSLYEPKPVEMQLDGPKLISNTASVKNTFVMEGDSTLIVCAEPSPDAAFSQDTDLDITISLIATDKGGDDDDGSEESEMAGRSPSVLLARELLYRLCEFSRNYHVEKDTAIELYKQNLAIIREIGGKESEHTSVKIGDAVTNAETLTVDERISGGRAKRTVTGKKNRDNSSGYDTYDSSSSGSNSSSSSDDDY